MKLICHKIYLTITLSILVILAPNLDTQVQAESTDLSTYYQQTFTFHTGLQSPIKDILEARLKEMFRRIGFKSELNYIASSQRALILANSKGDGDAARVSNIKEIAPANTANLIQVPESILNMDLTVYTKTVEFPVTGWESLAPYHNGARVGAKIIEKNIPGQRTLTSTTIQLFQMLDNKRIDTVVEWNFIAQKTQSDLNLSGIKQLSPPLIRQPFYLYIHKKHANLIPRLAQTLSTMKQDGSFIQLREDIINSLPQ
jgi:polar amino acid transport system substrate-binding protein